MKVGVIGAGTMGLINAQTAKAYGCRVIVSEMIPKKIETAKAMGFCDRSCWSNQCQQSGT